MNRQRVTKAILNCDRIIEIFFEIDPEFSLSSVRCLCEIALDEGISLTDLSRACGLPASSVTIIVGRLSDYSRYNKSPYGLVEKKRSPTDKRNYQLYLSPAGHKVIQKLSKVM